MTGFGVTFIPYFHVRETFIAKLSESYAGILKSFKSVVNLEAEV